MLPEENAHLVGYAFLIERYNLPVSLPEKLSLISHRHRRYEVNEWAIYTPRHQPEDNLPGHLTFALRYEGVNLEVLDSLFKIINPEIIARWVREQPTGRYSRRIWFLFERLTGKMLDVPDVIMGNYIDALDPKLQEVTVPLTSSRRHRVTNNMTDIIDSGASVGEKARMRGMPFESQSSDQDAHLKAVIKEHFDIQDHQVDQLIQFMYHNVNRYEALRDAGV
jgi:hypothetical protein